MFCSLVCFVFSLFLFGWLVCLFVCVYSLIIDYSWFGAVQRHIALRTHHNCPLPLPTTDGHSTPLGGRGGWIRDRQQSFASRTVSLSGMWTCICHSLRRGLLCPSVCCLFCRAVSRTIPRGVESLSLFHYHCHIHPSTPSGCRSGRCGQVAELVVLCSPF